jgi:Lon protease-like protein
MRLVVTEAERPSKYPVVPLRDFVAFPHTIVPLHIARKKSVNALDSEGVMHGRQQILLATQKNAGDPDPAPEAIYRMGTLATIMQGMKFDDGSIKVLFECTARAKIARYTNTTDYFEAEAELVVETPGSKEAIEVLAQSAVAQFAQYVRGNKQISPEAEGVVNRIRAPSEMADLIASHLAIEVKDKQDLLETTSVSDRLERILTLMGNILNTAEKEHDHARKRDTRAHMQLRKLHVTRYTGRYDWSSQDLANPSWDQVETSIRCLDQFKRPFVWLLLGEGDDWGAMEKEGYLNIIGGNGIYSVDGATPSDGRRRLSVPKHSREKHIDVWLSDQGFSTEEVFVCYELETILRVAKHFCVHGRLDPSVEWVAVSAVGAWDVF